MKTQRGGGSKLKRKLLFQAATKPPNQTYKNRISLLTRNTRGGKLDVGNRHGNKN